MGVLPILFIVGLCSRETILAVLPLDARLCTLFPLRVRQKILPETCAVVRARTAESPAAKRILFMWDH